MTVPLLSFCQVAIRLEASRRLAYRTWAQRSPGTSWEEFCAFWKVARRLEAGKKARAA